MKNLKDILKESLRIGINDTPDPNIEDIDYTDPEIKEFYLVRFMPEEQKIFVDIINSIRIKLEIDKPDKKVYNVSGDFSIIETNKYTNAAFTLDQSTGIIYRYVHAFTEYYDILIHPDYFKGFIKFVKSFINDEHATFYIDEVLDILGIDITNIPEKIKNVEYTASTQYFDRIKLFLKI